MKQIIRNNIKDKYPQKKKRIKTPKIGTSKLEDRFAKEFLRKINVEYMYQFKAESINRFYDFYIPNSRLLIEIDGDYYHGRGLKYQDMNAMQKRNNKVDRLKDEWALYNSYILLRISEYDINHNPQKVLKILKEEIKIGLTETKRVINI